MQAEVNNSMGILTALVLLAATGCSKPVLPKAPSIIPITSAAVIVRDVEQFKEYPAVLASIRPVQLTARVAGFLLRQEVADGSLVKTGQVIYRIDPAQYLAQLAEVSAALMQADAQRDFAADEVLRNKPLADVGAISMQDFDSLVTKLRSAEAQVLYQQAQVDIQELNVSYCTIASPMDGMLGKSLEYEGSMVGPGYATDLNLIVQTDPMWAQFSPSTAEWPVYIRQMEQGPVAAKVSFGLGRPIFAEGNLVFRNNEAGTSTSSLLMRVQFPNPAGVFVPGAIVDVSVSLGALKDAIVVPLASLWARETELFVWRIKADSTVEAVAVDVVMREEDQAIVSSGVSAGDRVVVTGVQKLRAGSKVVEAASAAATKTLPSAATLGQENAEQGSSGTKP